MTPGREAAADGDLHGIPARHVEYLCRVMHDAYEAEAARVGWATQQASRVGWDEVPEPNKAAMRAGVRALLDRLFVPEDETPPARETT